MKNTLFDILSFIASFIPIKFLIKITGINVIYPFYHIISDKPPAHIKHLYKVKTTKDFRKDLDFLTKHFISSHEINTELKSRENYFHLSFDDGLHECYTVIAPILKEYNIKASFFINSGFADNKDLFFRYKISLILNHFEVNSLSEIENTKIAELLNINNRWELIDIEDDILKLKYNNEEIINEIAEILNLSYEHYLEHNKPYLTSNQIKKLIDEGHQIGSHSINHPLYSKINEVEQIFQTTESMKFIIENFNVENKLFAFPFTDDKVTMSFFNKVFYKKNIDYSFGTAGIKKDAVKNNIQRIPLEKRNISAEKYIKTEYLLYFLKMVLGKDKIIRK